MEDSDRSLTNTTDVSYGGKVLAKLEAGQIATLKCARKRMKADITVTAGVGGAAGKTMSVNARVVDVVISKINLNSALTADANVVDVISSRIELKMPVITTNLIVEET